MFFDVVIFLKQVSKHHLMGAESVYIHVYDHIPYMGSVAERSKALVLGTSLFGGVGSNPTSVILICFDVLHGGLAQSVECVVRNDEAPGSKPGFSSLLARKGPSGATG